MGVKGSGMMIGAFCFYLLPVGCKQLKQAEVGHITTAGNKPFTPGRTHNEKAVDRGILRVAKKHKAVFRLVRYKRLRDDDRSLLYFGRKMIPVRE